MAQSLASTIHSQAKLVITCEHGGRQVPAEYKNLFTRFQKLLKSHRGSDMGALDFAQNISRTFTAALFFSQTTRLLVDLNRSVGHRDLFSEVIQDLDSSDRDRILKKFWRPYRESVENKISTWTNTSPVLHIAAHSFTPSLHGKTRHADVAFLYDPMRPGEKEFARRWAAELKKLRPDLLVRRNYPYEGKADGLMKTLRGRLSAKKYIGIELELNQKHLRNGKFPKDLQSSLLASLAAVIHAPADHFGRTK